MRHGFTSIPNCDGNSQKDLSSSAPEENFDQSRCSRFVPVRPEMVMLDDGSETFWYPNVRFEQEFEVGWLIAEPLPSGAHGLCCRLDTSCAGFTVESHYSFCYVCSKRFGLWALSYAWRMRFLWWFLMAFYKTYVFLCVCIYSCMYVCMYRYVCVWHCMYVWMWYIICIHIYIMYIRQTFPAKTCPLKLACVNIPWPWPWPCDK